MSLISWMNSDNWSTLRDKFNLVLDAVNTLVGDTKKTTVSSNDTTSGYLNGKLVAGTRIEFVENNDGANETLTINNTTALIKNSIEITSVASSIDTTERTILTLTPSTTLGSSKIRLDTYINLTASAAGSDVLTLAIKKNGSTIHSIKKSIVAEEKVSAAFFVVSTYAANDVITVTAKLDNYSSGTVPYAILLAESVE